MERKGGLGRGQYADRPAGYRGPTSSDLTIEAPRSLDDPLRRERPAEREGDLYDVNGDRGYLG